MARPLSTTVIRHLSSSSTRLATLRHHSSKSTAAVAKLEEVVHNVVIKGSKPDWLPLVPGGSFWVPPSTVARGIDKVVAGLVKEEREIVRKDGRCWPSSARFFKGLTQSPLEGETTSKHSKTSEEEENKAKFV
ncbi:uncharacterized protein LOC141651135 [Silene latifolia]|uniref:uncharacterized protein LOC141651135 n=1 Tax=Silene latifolia TaxID=37657 RepID=UPI003D76AA79